MTKKLEELLNLPESQDIVKEEEKKDRRFFSPRHGGTGHRRHRVEHQRMPL